MIKKARKKTIIHIGAAKFYNILKNIAIFIGKLLISLLFFNCFVSYALSPTGSMTPTYLSGDIFTVAYDFKLKHLLPDLSKSNYSMLKNTYNFLSKPLIKRPINRGDILAFKVSSFDYILCKRVIAKGGDTIEVHNGIIYVNDQPLKLTYKGSYMKDINGQVVRGELYEEDNNGAKYNVLYSSSFKSSLAANNIAKKIVPADSYVMIGDNRHGSHHFDGLFSFVNESEIEGRIIGSLIYIGKRSTNPITLLKSIDWSRFLYFHNNK